MRSPSRLFRNSPWLLILAAAPAIALGPGCTVIVAAGKVATTTVGVAADVTSATVRGTGKVAGAIVRATGEVADDGVRTAAKLSRSGTVVFIESGGQIVASTPWHEGLKLGAAGELARLDPALTAARIIRGGKAVNPGNAASSTTALQSGDVVEMKRTL